MGFRPRFNIGFFLFAIIVIGAVVWSSGFNLSILISVFVFIDLVISFAAINHGRKTGNHGTIIGGALCGLIALSSTQALDNPNFGTLLLQILGGVFGVGSFIISGSEDTFDR